MLNKKEILVVSSVATEFEDNTVKIEVLRSLDSLDKYIKETPHVIDELVIDITGIPFTSENIVNLKEILNNPYVSISDRLVYIIDSSLQAGDIESVLNNFNLKIDIIVETVNAMEELFVNQIVRGRYTEAEPYLVETVVVDMSVKEFLKNKDNLDKLVFDEVPELDDVNVNSIGEEIAEDIREKKIIDIVGVDKYALAATAIYVAYSQLNNLRVYMQEFDFEYGYLSDIIHRLKFDCKSVNFRDIRDNQEVLNNLNGKVNCILSNHKEVIKPNEALFNYIYAITNFDRYLNICDYKKISTGDGLIITTPTTIPGAMEVMRVIPDDIDLKKVVFVGVSSERANELDKNSYTSLLTYLLNEEVNTRVIKFGLETK